MAEPLRVPLRPLVAGDVVLDRDTARYVTRVHRRGPGDAFVVFDPEARLEADARVLSVGGRVECRIERVRTATAVARTGITLVQAIGKGDKPDHVIRDATALGVERLVFCVSRRTVVRPGDRSPARLDRWRTIAVEAARQSGRGDVPVVEGPMPFEDAVAGSTARGICLAPEASAPLSEAVRDWRLGEPLVLLIGPEGGFDGSEIESARSAGFVVARFGDFVLRTETAAVAVLGALIAHR